MNRRSSCSYSSHDCEYLAAREELEEKFLLQFLVVIRQSSCGTLICESVSMETENHVMEVGVTCVTCVVVHASSRSQFSDSSVDQ